MVNVACINIHLWIWAAGRIILSYSCNVSIRWKYELRKTFFSGVIDFIVIDECTGCIISCIYSTMAQPRLYSATTVGFIGYILSLAQRYFGVLFIFYQYLSTDGLTIEYVMLLIFAPSFDIFKMCRLTLLVLRSEYSGETRSVLLVLLTSQCHHVTLSRGTDPLGLNVLKGNDGVMTGPIMAIFCDAIRRARATNNSLVLPWWHNFI